MYKLNLTEQPAASSAPWLHVDSDDAVAAYTTGVLSTQVIPFSHVLAMLIGIPSNAYILAFLQLRAKYSPAAALYLNLALSDLLLLLSPAQRGPSSGSAPWFSSSSPCLSRPAASCTSPSTSSACFPTGATGCTGTTG